jgi:signal transduction histidine kinase
LHPNKAHLTLDLPVPEHFALQLRPLFERLNESIFVYSAAGELLLCNEPALRVLGASSQDEARVQSRQPTEIFDLTSLDGTSILPDEWPCRKALRGEVFSEYRMIVKRLGDGASFYANYSGMALRNSDGEIEQAVVLMREISEPRRQETPLDGDVRLRDTTEQLKEADRRKDDFIAMLAHELRNPLGPIRNGVYLLDRIGTDGEKQRQIRGMIERQVTHMTRLIDDLLDISRIARGKIMLEKSNIDLVELARNVVEDYRPGFETAKLSLQLSTPPQPVIAFADKTRVSQALGNLLHNAMKYAKPNSTVSMRLVAHESTATLCVKDDGVGIAPDLLPILFEPFAQGSLGNKNPKSGLGLGLALVKGLIGLHGGTVSARSEGIGHGAEFTIELPIKGARPVKPEQTSSAPAEGTGHRILIIEDNVEAAETLQLLLTIGGHEVRVATSARMALNVLKTWTPHTIVCDIGLPEVDGYTLCREMRSNERLKTARIIALTGYGQDDDIRRAKAAGFDLHLTKPVDPNELEMVLAGR